MSTGVNAHELIFLFCRHDVLDSSLILHRILYQPKILMESKKTEVKKVMISSTTLDLPEHRKKVLDACLLQRFLPLMMEHLPSNDLETISASIRMVDEADVYLGVFAYRYGHVPSEGNPDKISVTEMEYRRARLRGIPRIIFVMSSEHPISINDVEIGEFAEKLKAFKELVRNENIINKFSSAEELRSLTIHSLSQIPNEGAIYYTIYIGIPKYFSSITR